MLLAVLQMIYAWLPPLSSIPKVFNEGGGKSKRQPNGGIGKRSLPSAWNLRNTVTKIKEN